MAVLGLQFAFVLLADKIYLKMGRWRVTERNREVHILQYHLPADEYKQFRARYGRDMVAQVKTEIYNRTLAVSREPTCELGEEIFARYGVKCTP